MKKTLKAQLMAAVSMMLIALVALSSATFAWFTTSSNPTVGQIDLQVKAVDSLFLSAKINGGTAPTATLDWKTQIVPADIEGGQTLPTTGGTFAEYLLYNTSSTFNATSNSFWVPTDFAPGSTTPTGYQAATAADYVKFDLWAKSESAGAVNLFGGTSSDSLVKAIASLGGAEITDIDADNRVGIKYTVRVGFVPYAADGTTLSWAGAVIWQPNSTAHVPIAISGLGTLPTGFLDVQGVTGALTSDVANQTTYDFVSGKTNTSADTKIKLFDLAAATPKKFAVYIWVEGADVDTVNAVAKSFFSTFLKFSFDKA